MTLLERIKIFFGLASEYEWGLYAGKYKARRNRLTGEIYWRFKKKGEDANIDGIGQTEDVWLTFDKYQSEYVNRNGLFIVDPKAEFV